MTQSCIISTTPFASAIQACGRACSQPLAFYVTCVCFLLVAVCYVVHERAARKVAEYEQRQVTQATHRRGAQEVRASRGALRRRAALR